MWGAVLKTRAVGGLGRGIYINLASGQLVAGTSAGW